MYKIRVRKKTDPEPVTPNRNNTNSQIFFLYFGSKFRNFVTCKKIVIELESLGREHAISKIVNEHGILVFLLEMSTNSHTF